MKPCAAVNFELITECFEGFKYLMLPHCFENGCNERPSNALFQDVSVRSEEECVISSGQ